MVEVGEDFLGREFRVRLGGVAGIVEEEFSLAGANQETAGARCDEEVRVDVGVLERVELAEAGQQREEFGGGEFAEFSLAEIDACGGRVGGEVDGGDGEHGGQCSSTKTG